MWVARFQLPELTKVPSGDGGERGTLCAGADIDALISEDHRAIAADQTEGVEDVGEKGQMPVVLESFRFGKGR